MKYEYWLYGGAALAEGWVIGSYYTSRLPDFDIGFNEAFTTLRCGVFILVGWGLLTGVLRLLNARIPRRSRFRLGALAAVVVYGLIVWAYCYDQCVVKAMRDWADFMNGNVG